MCHHCPFAHCGKDTGGEPDTALEAQACICILHLDKFHTRVSENLVLLKAWQTGVPRRVCAQVLLSGRRSSPRGCSFMQLPGIAKGLNQLPFIGIQSSRHCFVVGRYL